MADDVDIIIITAEKRNGSSGLSSAQYDFIRLRDQQNRQPTIWQPPAGSGTPYKSEPASSNTGDGETITVNIELNNSANEAEATKAAENILKALVEIEAALKALDPNTQVQWFSGGEMMTAAEALNELANTVFVIDDSTNYGNGGLGTADRGADGAPNTVILNFDAFDGDGGDYADPNYIDNQGVVAMMLHELGHVTAQGENFDELSRRTYILQNGSDAGYNFSEYWFNNEAYVYDFAKQFSSAMGTDIGQFWGALSPNFTGGAVHPAQIAQDQGPNP